MGGVVYGRGRGRQHRQDEDREEKKKENRDSRLQSERKRRTKRDEAGARFALTLPVPRLPRCPKVPTGAMAHRTLCKTWEPASAAARFSALDPRRVFFGASGCATLNHPATTECHPPANSCPPSA